MSDRPLPVIVNRSGGAAAAMGDALADRLREAFAAAGARADIRLVAGAEIAEAVAEAREAPRIVVGGGDGTLGGAAQARAESGGGALAILPLGTRNHLARELGVPLDLAGAATLAATGRTRRIDLATVNGRGFVNNASVGFYPLLVRRREASQRRGLPKWLATLPAGWATLRQLPHHRLSLAMEREGHVGVIRTPLLFVGNNRYELERGRVGKRAALDDGLLSVFALAAGTRAGLVWLALRTFVGAADPERDFEAVGETARLEVRSRGAMIPVALDGEVHRLAPPLRFEIRRGALEVVVGEDAAG